MKILIITHEYPPVGGGGANACMFLAEQYAMKGHDVTIVTVYYEGLSEYEELYDGRVKLYRLKAKRRYKDHCSFSEMADYLLKSKRFCEKLINDHKYDICQVFFGIPSGPIAYCLKKKYNIPYVIRFGGGDIPGFQNRFKLLYKMLGVPLKSIWRKADALVANSEGLKKFALDFYDKCNIDIIYNGVDADKFAPSREKTENDNTELLFVSRLIERKGLQFLIPHLKDIEDRTSERIHLTIVGDGPYRKTLEEIAVTNGVFDMISFVGQVDKQEIANYYSKGDVFVFPSYREGMPNAVLEAMASGLPIVMMENCEGSRELIDKNGILAKSDFCEALEELLKLDIDQRNLMGNASREKAIRDFSWDSISNQYLHLFENIVKNKENKKK